MTGRITFLSIRHTGGGAIRFSENAERVYFSLSQLQGFRKPGDALGCNVVFDLLDGKAVRVRPLRIAAEAVA